MKSNRVKGGDPLVSVCCTSHNMEHIIARTIDSILEQRTDFPFELIIHDDASTDRTQEIIKGYAERYPETVRTVLQKKNIYTSQPGGLGFMFNNYILPETRGKFIAISDGDDYWTDPEKLQKQVDHLNTTPESVACFTNALIINEIAGEKERIYHKNLNEGFVPEFNIALRGGSIYSASTLMFRKKEFTESIFYKCYDEFSEYLEYDTLFIFCLMLAGKISYLNDVTAIYRQWQGGVFSSIMYDPDKTAQMKEREIRGTKMLIGMVDKHRKKLFKRKVSVEALFVLRNRPGFGKYRYLKDLHFKEVIKFLTGRS